MTTAAPAAGAPRVGSAAPVGKADRRGTELLLLIFALAIVGLSLVLVEMSQEQRITWTLVRIMVCYAALMLGAHVAIRFFAKYADPLILPIVALLNGLGLVLIHRLDLASAASAAYYGEEAPSAYAGLQIVWSAIAVVAFIAVLALLRDYRLLARYSYTLGLCGLVLLVIPAVLPASMSEVNGAKIWIRLPFFSIQPGEFAKILLIIFFASLLVAKRDLFTTAGKHFLGMDLPRGRDLGPILIVWVVAVGVLVLEKDLGTSLLLFGTILTMIYIATERISWVAIGVGLLMVGFFFAYQMFWHVQVRVHTWLDPFEDANDTGYQITQSLFGLATGGLAGTGLGSGRPDIVPFANSDFIVATIGEEMGLIGLTAVLVLFMVLIIRGMRTALAVRDSFGKLLVGGLAVTMAIQLFVVVGGVTKLIPLTGLTTPFMSYGGSSLLANYILVAILIRVSSSAREPAHVKRPIAHTNPGIGVVS